MNLDDEKLLTASDVEDDGEELDTDDLASLFKGAVEEEDEGEDEGEETPPVKGKDAPPKKKPAKAAPAADEEDDAEDEADDEDEEGEAPEKPAPKAKGEEEKAKPPKGELTQAKVDSIVTERLAQQERQFQARLAKELEPLSALKAEIEALSGQPIDKFLPDLRKASIAAMAEKGNMTVEEAKAKIAADMEVKKAKEELAKERAEHALEKQRDAYAREKEKFSSHQFAPLAKEFASEVDAIAKDGTEAPYDVALAYVIGQKFLSGDLVKRIRTAVRAEVLAERARQPKTSPSTGSQSGGGETVLPGQVRRFAKAFERFGITEEEVTKEYQGIQRHKGKR